MDQSMITRRMALKMLGGSALAAAVPAGVRAQGKEPLRFGIQTTLWAAIAMVAEAEKMWDKAGVNVVVNKFDSGANARDAMIGGKIDIVSIGATPFIIGVAKSDLVGFAMSCYAGSTLSLVAGKKSGIKSVADLKGRKIASQLGSQTDYVFQNKIAPAFGLKPTDFEVINTKFADHISALASGSVDAFAGVEPSPSVAEVEGLGTVLTDYSKYDIVPVMLATNNTVLKQRQEDLVKFMRGWMMAVDLTRKDLKKAAHLVGEFFRARGNTIKDEVLQVAMKRMDITPDYRPELKTYLTELSETQVKNKRLSEVPDIDRALNRQIQQRVARA